MTRKQKRLALIGSALGVLGLAVGLMLFALRWPQPLLNWVCGAWYGMLVFAWARLRRDVRLSKEAGR